MRLFFFIVLFLFVFSVGAQAEINLQTEVDYPSILGISSPKEIIDFAESQEEIFPLFVTYLFRLLLTFSVFVGLGVVLYGGILYVLSGENPEKKKIAKEWMFSAFHGALVLFSSYLLLSIIDSRLVDFENLTQLKKIEDLDEDVFLEWTIKSTYFQIPFGLLAEEASTNVNARDKFYDILDAIYDAEDTADAIIWGGNDLLEIIDVCPVGMCCLSDEPYCETTPIPFSSLKRAKETRPNLECWWDYRAVRSSSRNSMARPPLPLLPRDMMDYNLGISEIKNNMRSSIDNLESVMNSYFGARAFMSESMLDLEEKLIDIINKIDYLIKYQDRYIELDIETRKVTDELSSLIEKYPLLKEKPFKTVINEMSEDWLLGKESLAKGEFGYDEIPFTEQFDLTWRHIRYNIDTIFHSGCLLASTIMVLNHLDDDVAIVEAMHFAKANGHASMMGGTFFSFPCHFAQTRGFSCFQVSNPSTSHLSTMINWLENRGPVVIGGIGHPWSMGGGHAITLTGVDKSKGIVYMNDPSRSFTHSVTFGEVLANMPIEIAYISKKSALNNSSFSSRFTGGGDGVCPEISCAIMIKINEIMFYMFKHDRDLWVVFFAKDLKKESLYHLYKTLMLKSLGAENIMNYPSLLLEKSHYNEREEVFLETYDEYTEIHRYNLSGENPYIWNWEKWLNNILYTKEIDCNPIIENDPLTFYLRKPSSDNIIRDALIEGAYRKKQQDFQYLNISSLFEKPLSNKNIAQKFNSLATEILSVPYLEDAINSVDIKKEMLPENISLDFIWFYKRFLSKSSMIASATESPVFGGENIDIIHDSDFISCGMEIPVGETFQLIWDHFIELLFTMDGYIVEGFALLELQEYMNYLSSYCTCPCAGPPCPGDPPPSSCTLTCDKNEIRRVYFEEIIPKREEMAVIAQYLKHLTHGYFYDTSENLCHRLNEDIRGDDEKRFCNQGGSKYITMHELITRKLHYSRSSFDNCINRPEHLEDIIAGKKGKSYPVFGIIAEQRNLERYTKTKIDNNMVNTHRFNWFCCYDSER